MRENLGFAQQLLLSTRGCTCTLRRREEEGGEGGEEKLSSTDWSSGPEMPSDASVWLQIVRLIPRRPVETPGLDQDGHSNQRGREEIERRKGELEESKAREKRGASKEI